MEYKYPFGDKPGPNYYDIDTLKFKMCSRCGMPTSEKGMHRHWQTAHKGLPQQNMYLEPGTFPPHPHNWFMHKVRDLMNFYR